jgi:acetyltransferase-like isoleucine patch superfamily enzyme
VLGKPEHGYAVGREYPGTGAETEIGSEVVLRSGSIVYAGCMLGEQTTIGHHTTLRSHVSVGARSQLAHRMSVERSCRIGHSVRCSPGSHITSEVVMEDGVFIGAGVVTVNDKGMIWRDPQRLPVLLAPYFAQGAKIGSGSSIAAGVRVGREALVGMGSVVTRDVPDYAIAYGVPAQVRGQVREPPLADMRGT